MAIGLIAFAATAGAVPAPFTITLESTSPYYEPAYASVSAGSAVVWVNPTASYHTIQHDGCEDGPVCAFNSGSVAPNGRYVLEHLPPGEYRYHCELHPIMRGVLIVTSPAVTTES
ncbi:MAG TPA: cupredoxin domain-containing protein [Nitrospirales bacterium]|nr:cupredoxin domain-containing protein [Nitrospirales bacterium]